MSAREAARRVLRRVEQGQAYATLALGGALAGLSPADRGLATEIVYGVLRHRARLDRAVAAQAPRGLKLPPGGMAAVRVAAYQLLFLRVPAHAAIDDAVDAVKRLAGAPLARFANAVLRRLASTGEPPPPADRWERLESVSSLPRWIAERVPDAEIEAFAAAINEPAPLAVRTNLTRIGRVALGERLVSERPRSDVTAPAEPPEALIVRGAGAPEALASFQEGLFTVQDVAAQRVGRLVGAAPGEDILDACAGVGGKTTHLQEQAIVAGGPARIVAVDKSRRKLDLCEDAARRLGLPGIRAVVADATELAGGVAPASGYDRVLLDAPCSGLGVLRRHPEAKWRRPPDVAALAALQARLLAALAPRVRRGGILVYSVCTFTAEEGPDQTSAFVRDHPGFRRTDELVTWPQRDGSDAFFAVRLERIA